MDPISEKIFNLGDSRTQGWFLVDSPGIIASLICAYLSAVCLGPNVMKNRRPCKLRIAMGGYNVAMAVFNGYICMEMLTTAFRRGYSVLCEPCRDINHPDEIKIANIFWCYFISKLFEFSDTVFIILRKKREQLTFLHIYHHSTMFFLCWLSVKWVPTGGSFFPVVLNSFVHVVMYSYYAFTILRSNNALPKHKQHIWWKRYLTVLQLVQFVLALLWSSWQLLTGCEFPAWCNYISIAYMIVFLILFGRFYGQSYGKCKQ